MANYLTSDTFKTYSKYRGERSGLYIKEITANINDNYILSRPFLENDTFNLKKDSFLGLVVEKNHFEDLKTGG